jgi:peptide chain release factor subunit 1
LVSSTESVSRFKLKRTLETLASKEGRGTELISLYVPPEKRIHEVMTNLREEYGTASNIKSRVTRKNVQEAIEKVQQRLKLFKTPPPKGLVIFCGAIPYGAPGNEKMEIYTLEPPEKINVYFYRCDSRFHLEPLFDMMREKDTYGVLVIDSNEAILATLRGQRMSKLKEFTSGIPGKHRAGGQSARRFERLREASVNEYFKRVASHTNEMVGKISDLRGLILGGPGPTKYDFEEGDYLNYVLKQKIIATIDTSYVSERGVEEVVERSQDLLKGVRYAEEKRTVQKFLYELGHETGLASYGETQVRRHLNAGLVSTLLLSEKLDRLHVLVRCKTCGDTEDALLARSGLTKFEQELLSKQCKKCSNTTLAIENTQNLLDEFVEMAEKSSVNLEVISTETEEGIMLLESFGGIAAILRYRPSG